MPWKENLMLLREEFIYRALGGSVNISKLCKEYGISRQAGYKWIRRYKEEGALGLSNRSTRPCRMPSKLDEKTINLILSVKEEHSDWGAKKLRQILVNRGHKHLPSIASTNRILKRNDKIDPAASEKRKPYIRFEREHPNELWQMDFKGYFAVGDGNCHPFTLLDDCSRYALCLKACASENEIAVRIALEEVFYEYGLPIAMTMDNGAPWKGYAKQRLSSLTIWLMRLGIRVGHSRPAHPQTQGKLERFHQSFKKEVLKYHNYQSLSDAQNGFNAWREIYNHIRPHEALNLLCPAQKYERSPRKYLAKLPPIEYPQGDEIRKVDATGQAYFKGNVCWIGKHLKGEYVAFRQRGETSEWDIYYVNTRLGGFSLKSVNHVLIQV